MQKKESTLGIPNHHHHWPPDYVCVQQPTPDADPEKEEAFPSQVAAVLAHTGAGHLPATPLAISPHTCRVQPARQRALPQLSPPPQPPLSTRSQLQPPPPTPPPTFKMQPLPAKPGRALPLCRPWQALRALYLLLLFAAAGASTPSRRLQPRGTASIWGAVAARADSGGAGGGGTAGSDGRNPGSSLQPVMPPPPSPPACPPGRESCGGGCVDLLSDVAHCGSCNASCIGGGHARGASPQCQAGTCTMECDADFSECPALDQCGDADPCPPVCIALQVRR